MQIADSQPSVFTKGVHSKMSILTFQNICRSLDELLGFHRHRACRLWMCSCAGSVNKRGLCVWSHKKHDAENWMQSISFICHICSTGASKYPYKIITDYSMTVFWNNKGWRNKDILILVIFRCKERETWYIPLLKTKIPEFPWLGELLII